MNKLVYKLMSEPKVSPFQVPWKARGQLENDPQSPLIRENPIPKFNHSLFPTTTYNNEVILTIIFPSI